MKTKKIQHGVRWLSGDTTAALDWNHAAEIAHNYPRLFEKFVEREVITLYGEWVDEVADEG